MQAINLWKLTPNGNHHLKAESIEAVTGTDTEQLLEEVLTSSPGLLLTDLWLVGRQTPTPGGPLDLLGVDEDGHLVVFELKKGVLTRDAVAQAIDYASYLADLTADDLCRLISENSGKLGIEKLDFRERYETEYPDQVIAEIGVPRIVLVGLGVDDRAKRMVQFLAKSSLDISLVTFYGFKLAGETLLARQVEVQATSSQGAAGSKKAANQAELNRVLAKLGIRQNYDALITATQKGLASSIYYQYPYTTGNSFSLRESGGRYPVCIGLFALEDRNGKIQLVLQARALEAMEIGRVQELAKAMGSSLEIKPTGWGEIWIDGRKAPENYSETLATLAQALAVGWNAKMAAKNQAAAEEEEVAEGVQA
jgi:endonuclease NucS-like protein